MGVVADDEKLAVGHVIEYGRCTAISSAIYIIITYANKRGGLEILSAVNLVYRKLKHTVVDRAVEHINLILLVHQYPKVVDGELRHGRSLYSQSLRRNTETPFQFVVLTCMKVGDIKIVC